jgi:hypothetical protein
MTAKCLHHCTRPVCIVSDKLHRTLGFPHPRRATRLLLGFVITTSGVALMTISEHFMFRVIFESVGLCVHAAGVTQIVRSWKPGFKLD